jgi:hypothetical protein
MKLEAFDYDLDERYAFLLQKMDDITSEIYSLGAFEERKMMLDKMREIIQQKDVSGDLIAVEVLCWTLEQLVSQG